MIPANVTLDTNPHRDGEMVVLFEFDPAILLGETSDPMQALAEICTAKAEEMAHTGGHRLRSSEPLEITVSTGIEAATGAERLLIRTRWSTDRLV